MILFYFLLSRQELLKHINSNLYICNIQEAGRRRPRACGLKTATDWIFEPSGDFRVPLMVRNPDVAWPEVWDIDRSNDELILFSRHGGKNQQFNFINQGELGGYTIRKGGRCITYNELSNSYSIDLCSSSDNQRFDILPDNRLNIEPESPMADIFPIYNEPEEVDLQTGRVVRRPRSIPRSREPEVIGNEIGEWTCPGKKSGAPGTYLNTAPPLRTQQGMIMGSGSLIRSGPKSILTEMEMSKSRSSSGSMSREGVTGPNMCNMGFLH